MAQAADSDDAAKKELISWQELQQLAVEDECGSDTEDEDDEKKKHDRQQQIIAELQTGYFTVAKQRDFTAQVEKAATISDQEWAGHAHRADEHKKKLIEERKKRWKDCLWANRLDAYNKRILKAKEDLENLNHLSEDVKKDELRKIEFSIKQEIAKGGLLEEACTTMINNTCYVRRRATSQDRIDRIKAQLEKKPNDKKLQQKLQHHKSALQKECDHRASGQSFPDNGFNCAGGTGLLLFFKMGGQKVIITNKHVIMNDEEAKSALLYFDYHDDFKLSGLQPIRVKGCLLSGLFQGTIDMSVLAIHDDDVNKLPAQGVLWEEPRALVGDQIQFTLGYKPVIIAVGHPRGAGKRLSVAPYPDLIHDDTGKLHHAEHKAPTTKGNSGSGMWSFQPASSDNFNPWIPAPFFLHYAGKGVGNNRIGYALSFFVIGDHIRSELTQRQQASASARYDTFAEFRLTL